MTVAVLFARADSVYKTLPDVEVYDAERDARTYDGPKRRSAAPARSTPALPGVGGVQDVCQAAA